MKPSEERKWLKHYDKDALKNSNIIDEGKTLWDVLEEKIFEYENIPAIDYYGRIIRRLEFREMVYNWAKTFKAMGINKGDIIPIFSTFTPSVSAMALALNLIGACPNFIKLGLSCEKYNYELKDGKFAIILSALYNDEMNNFFNQDRIKKVIIATPYDDMLMPKKTIVSALSKLQAYKNKTNIPKNSKYIWYDEAIKIGNYYYGDLKSEFEKNTPAFITYSSGTTSDALKGTIATNESAISQLKQGKFADMGYEAGKVCLTQFPPTASTALNCLFLSPFYCGMILNMYPSPNYKEFYGQIMQSKPHFSISTGAVWKEFFKEYIKKDNKSSLDFLKVAVIGGDGATVDEIDWMNSILGKHSDNLKMHVGYGLSESFSVVTFDKPGIKYDSEPNNKIVPNVGIPYPGMTVGVFDENGKELGYNERGELWVKSKSNMLGYYNKPDLTKKIYCGEWIKTGDICELDQEGRIFLYGRKNDFIEYNDNKHAYLFDIANNVIALSSNKISSCIIRKYESNENNHKLLCHIVFKKNENVNIFDLFDKINNYIADNYGNDIKIVGYKVHDEFKINPASLKTNRLILDKELNDFYVEIAGTYENGDLRELLGRKMLIDYNCKKLLKNL